MGTWASMLRGCWHSPQGAGAERELPGYCSGERFACLLTVGRGCPEDNTQSSWQNLTGRSEG